jgi:hypothetical protein
MIKKNDTKNEIVVYLKNSEKYIRLNPGENLKINDEEDFDIFQKQEKLNLKTIIKRKKYERE